MHPKRKQKLILLLGGLLVSALAAGLILNAFRSSLVFFHTPSELVQGQAAAMQLIRVGGLVSPGSLSRKEGGLNVSFSISDTVHAVPVNYRGILPDLFREGRGVVVQGRLDAHGVLQAEQVLAKHDEKYLPPEARDAVTQAAASQQGQK